MVLFASLGHLLCGYRQYNNTRKRFSDYFDPALGCVGAQCNTYTSQFVTWACSWESFINFVHQTNNSKGWVSPCWVHLMFWYGTLVWEQVWKFPAQAVNLLTLFQSWFFLKLTQRCCPFVIFITTDLFWHCSVISCLPFSTHHVQIWRSITLKVPHRPVQIQLHCLGRKLPLTRQNLLFWKHVTEDCCHHSYCCLIHCGRRCRNNQDFSYQSWKLCSDEWEAEWNCWRTEKHDCQLQQHHGRTQSKCWQCQPQSGHIEQKVTYSKKTHKHLKHLLTDERLWVMNVSFIAIYLLLTGLVAFHVGLISYTAITSGNKIRFDKIMVNDGHGWVHGSIKVVPHLIHIWLSVWVAEWIKSGDQYLSQLEIERGWVDPWQFSFWWTHWVKSLTGNPSPFQAW